MKTIEVFKKPTVDNFKDMVGDFKDIVKIVTIAPEEDIDLISYLNDKNIKTQAGHTIGTSLKKCKGTTHLFNAMNGIHHRDNSVALEALISDDVYCEIIADLIHCSKEIIKLLLKCKLKEKILLVSDSLPSSHYNKNIVFCGKKISKEGKDSKGIIAGSNKTLDEICKKLLNEGILSKQDINQMAFINQIEYLNLKNNEIDILNSNGVIYKNKENIIDVITYMNTLFFREIQKEKDIKQIEKYARVIETLENTKKRINTNANFEMSIDNMLIFIYETLNKSE